MTTKERDLAEFVDFAVEVADEEWLVETYREGKVRCAEITKGDEDFVLVNYDGSGVTLFQIKQAIEDHNYEKAGE